VQWKKKHNINAKEGWCRITISSSKVEEQIMSNNATTTKIHRPTHVSHTGYSELLPAYMSKPLRKTVSSTAHQDVGVTGETSPLKLLHHDNRAQHSFILHTAVKSSHKMCTLNRREITTETCLTEFACSCSHTHTHTSGKSPL
jgi:hypothetical protein